MRMKKENSSDSKRWIAIGLAIVLFILSSISSSLSKMFLTRINDETSTTKLVSSLMKSLQYEEEVLSGTNASERILVVPIEGTISDTGVSVLSSTGYNHQLTLNILDSVKKDPTIAGIVLKVNSPGGGTFESAQVHDKIMELKNELEIPVYSSMGSMAASGGYYVSAPADKIFASKETITGSIGVIMSSTNYTGLFEKLGLQDQTIKSGANKDIGSASRPMTEEEREILQNFVNSSYQRFVTVVEQGRRMDRNKVLELADGRIYDGEQAKNNGLVDEIGYLEQAMGDMTETLNLTDPEVFVINATSNSPFLSLFGVESNLLSGKNQSLQSFINILSQYGVDNSPRPMYLYGGEQYE